MKPQGISPLLGNDLERVGITLAGDGVTELEPLTLGREVDCPVGIVGQEVEAAHVGDKIFVDLPAEAGELDGRGQDVLPGKLTVLLVYPLQTASLTRDATVDTRQNSSMQDCRGEREAYLARPPYRLWSGSSTYMSS